MADDDYDLDKYKKFLLNRVTATTVLVESIEKCLQTENKAAKHYFHKIMIHNWQDTLHQLFDRLSSYYGKVLGVVPVNCSTQGDIATFYTSNLSIIADIIKFDFMFPFNRNMFSIDILFNDKTSAEFFGTKTTIDEIVSGVVSRRFSERCELDLSNFCDDPEFSNKKIFFYKISLLANFKILMLRMGRDTKMLNLSNNNLSQAPLEILNFFIKADLTAVNLSNNNILSITELSRVSSKIEKLWLEGNPLCENLDPVAYVKTVTVKFPRLVELDGVSLNQHGMVFPFYRNYLCSHDRKTKMVVEKFVTLYFSNYDQPPSVRKKKIETLYDEKAIFTLACDFAETDQSVSHYTQYSRNLLNPNKNPSTAQSKTYKSRQNIVNVLGTLPETVHDRSTFTVDVLSNDKKSLHIIIDGIFREKIRGNLLQFRRNFMFGIYTVRDNSVYHIVHDMFSLTYANTDQMNYSFQHPIRNMNSLSLINPTPDESEAIIKAFQHLTQLKRPEVELRLKYHGWDIRDALKNFMADAKSKKMATELFMDSDFSDSSSILDDIDY
ncbi:nuclear RNA export factor 2 [Helicoverpa armigera]|uniref:nuclear RNA export factor 2 n=1 Tax=Helicoverpa armigera TaxID=29058 RepID=UPI00308299FD